MAISLANMSGGVSSLGYYNPAFKIKIVNPNDALQPSKSRGRNNQEDDFLDNLNVGDEIVAKIGKLTVAGKIARVIRNEENEGVYIEMTSKTGETYKVDGSRIVRSNQNRNSDDDMKATSSPSLFAENNHIKSFSDFLNERLTP